MSQGLTPSQTVGPFFSIGLIREGDNELVPNGGVRVSGRVLDGAGEPVPDAVVELWQQGADRTLWGRCGTDAEGRFDFVTARPPTGHAEVMVFARGLLRHLVTRCPIDSDNVQFDIRLQGDDPTVFFDV
jgi:protocatechuate 3,4-dioxygenase, alpha subunit